MALATVDRVSYAYPDAPALALRDVSTAIDPGEVVVVLGPSGSGKSTLLRALAGLVPHFHGGRFEGRVVVAGRDTRAHRPADLAGTIAFLFQDPEDQVVLTRADREVAFGLSNLGVAPARILPRALRALAAVGAAHLAGRPVQELSGGELQRVCLASALALEPELLLLDEPTSQLDPAAADGLVELAASLARDRGTAVLLSEQRPALPLDHADRVLFLDGGRILLDSPRAEALDWLAANRPDYVRLPGDRVARPPAGEVVCRLDDVSYSYRPGLPVVEEASLALRRGEVVALTGPNGSGKTTLAKLAAGLLSPHAGTLSRCGRATYLLQDAGRYLLRERADEEVALAVGGDLERARRELDAIGLAGAAGRHPRDLSSGERERLALAAVTVAEPDLLVLDEPTRGVDPERKRRLAERLRRDAPGRATLVVTHDLAFAAAAADRRVELGTMPEPVGV